MGEKGACNKAVYSEIWVGKVTSAAKRVGEDFSTLLWYRRRGEFSLVLEETQSKGKKVTVFYIIKILIKTPPERHEIHAKITRFQTLQKNVREHFLIIFSPARVRRPRPLYALLRHTRNPPFTASCA